MSLVREVTAADLPAICRIYRHYVLDTVVTFEEVPPAEAELAARIEEVRRDGLPWLVAEQDGVVAGYAYATKWKSRAAYRYATESTVYVDEPFHGRGVGTALYIHLFDALRAAGIHTVIGGIALPNDASIALHEKLGMKKVAHFEEVGYKFGRRVDVAYWQRIL